MSAAGATQPEAMPDPGGPGEPRDGADEAPVPVGALSEAEAQPVASAAPATVAASTALADPAAPAALADPAAPAALADPAAPEADAFLPAQEEYTADEHATNDEDDEDDEDVTADEDAADDDYAEYDAEGYAADAEYAADEHATDDEYVTADEYVEYAEYVEYDEYFPRDFTRQPVSKLAITALVCGLAALLPLALGFGIAALITIRRTGHRGAHLALTGIYAAWIWVLIAAAGGGLFWFTHGFRPQVHTQYRPVAAYGLLVGDCFNTSQNASGFTLTACGSPHEAEVYGRFKLTGSAYPGARSLQQQASQGCAPLFATYVNSSLTNIGYNLVYVYPDRQAWTAGERTVICEARFTDGTISGSIRAG